MRIRLLEEGDERSHFDSGDAALDRFFHLYAGQNQFRHHVGTTYVAMEGSGIVGYATVAAGHVELERMPKALRSRFPRYPLPVLRLARLAVSSASRGAGVGEALLRFVFQLALRMTRELGCVGVVVDAKPGAIDYYSRFGFTPMHVVEGRIESRPRPTPMFLSIGEIERAVRGD